MIRDRLNMILIDASNYILVKNPKIVNTFNYTIYHIIINMIFYTKIIHENPTQARYGDVKNGL